LAFCSPQKYRSLRIIAALEKPELEFIFGLSQDVAIFKYTIVALNAILLEICRVSSAI